MGRRKEASVSQLIRTVGCVRGDGGAGRVGNGEVDRRRYSLSLRLQLTGLNRAKSYVFSSAGEGWLDNTRAAIPDSQRAGRTVRARYFIETAFTVHVFYIRDAFSQRSMANPSYSRQIRAA